MDATLFSIPLVRIDGRPVTLADYRGKVLLVVNVASKCGLTPQYESLQRLYAQRWAQGLEILGFPANNFGGQEPGTEAEISEFCTLRYEVEFPLFQKISVAGSDRHPLYDALVAAQPRATGSDPPETVRVPGAPSSESIRRFHALMRSWRLLGARAAG